MDKNSIIGIILIGAVLITFGILNSPSKEEIEAARHRQDSIAAVQKAAMNDSLNALRSAEMQHTALQSVKDTAAADDSTHNVSIYGTFAAAASGEAHLYTIENELMKVTLSTRGGKPVAVQLKNYKTWDGKPLILFEGDSSAFGINFFAQNKNISTNLLYFKPIGDSFIVNDKNKKSITMRLDAGENRFLDYTYSLEGKSYLLGFDIKTIRFNELIASNANYLEMEWRMGIPRLEKNLKNEKASSAIYYKYVDDEVESLSAANDEQKTLKTKVKWVSFKGQFFTSVLMADKSFDKPTDLSSISQTESTDEVKYMSANFTIPYSHQAEESFGMQYYFGPNHYQTLKKIGFDLEKQIPLGWGILGLVNKGLVIPIFNFLNSFDLNYGIIILILTIVIKIILLPLTYRSYLSTAKMKVLKPEVDEIQARKGDDPMKTQQELMALYKKAGVNPLGGCIPMILQMPILLAMFRFFPASIELRQEGFLWAKDLSTYDSILDLGFNIPGYGNHVSLFTLLMTLSTLLYTYANNQMTVGTNPQMKWMMYLMPLIFLGILNDYSAGLSYYYFLANMISFGQQYLFRSLVDEKAIHAKIQENKRKPQTAKKSGFQQRLEQMAKERGYKK
jgi:YidC/Oxa1 family membrane protein insertase